MNTNRGNTIDEKKQIDRDEEERHIDDRLIAIHALHERQSHKERVVEPEREIDRSAQPSAKAQQQRQQKADETHHCEQDSVCGVGLNDLCQPHMLLGTHRRRDDETRTRDVYNQGGKLLLIVRNDDRVAACERPRKDHQKEYDHLP